MTSQPLRICLSLASLLILTACGGQDIVTASSDCANAACSAPVIDGLAEQYRAAALAREKSADDEAVPVYPRVPST